VTLQKVFLITFGTLVVLPYAVRAIIDVSRSRATREQIRNRRGTPDAYDGHEDYLEETAGTWARAQAWITAPLDPMLAIAAGVVVGRGTALAIWPGGDNPVFALLAVGGILVAALIGAVVVMALFRTVCKDFTHRLAAYAVVAAAFFWWFVQPVILPAL
jgi:hypothetical protein